MVQEGGDWPFGCGGRLQVGVRAGGVQGLLALLLATPLIRSATNAPISPGGDGSGTLQ